MKYFLLSVSVICFSLFYSTAEARSTAYKKMTAKEEKLSLKLGNSLYEENKLEDALMIFQDFIELYPDSSRRSQALEKIAIIYEERQEYVSARRVYLQLFEELGLSTRGLGYYFEAGRLSEIMGNVKEAYQVYETIIQALPGSDLAQKVKRRIRLDQLFSRQKI